MLPAFMVTKRAGNSSLLGLAIALSVGLYACGKSPTAYVDPNASITTTQTPTALISAATLKQWMDEGKVNNNDPNTRDRVVIITVSGTVYTTSHIPGSLFFKVPDISPTRSDALAPVGLEACDGATMDAMLERFGIDGRTTVVFTVSRAAIDIRSATRAYYTFRYWGFPRERLKVLDGGDDAWFDAGFALTAAFPTPTPSTFSVRSNYRGNTDCLKIRIALGPMIDLVDRVNLGSVSVSSPTGITILDVRGVDPLTGQPPTSYIANSLVDDYTKYFTVFAGKTPTYLTSSDVVSRLATFGVTASKKMTYITCNQGVQGTILFFFLDGVLGWPATMYDASYEQWPCYTTANNVGVAWRVNTNSPGTTLPRTFGTLPVRLLTPDPIANVLYLSITDPRADQIFREDKAYFTSGGGGGGGGSPGGGGGGSDPPSGC